MEENEKLRRGNSSYQKDQDDAERFGEKRDYAETMLSLWEKLLTMIVTPGPQHGSTKEAATDWITFFQDSLGEEIPDAPLIFQQSNMEFPQVIVVVSTHIATLQNEKQVNATKASNALKRVEWANQRAERRARKATAKAEALVEVTLSGRQEEIDEKKRTGCKPF